MTLDLDYTQIVIKSTMVTTAAYLSTFLSYFDTAWLLNRVAQKSKPQSVVHIFVKY